MNSELLLEYADWLETNVPEKKFDFVTLWEDDPDCGSVGCAIGWLPAFDGRVERAIENSVRFLDAYDYESVASRYFNIPYDDASNLFTPYAQALIEGWGYFPKCERDATPTEVANAIRHYVEIRS